MSTFSSSLLNEIFLSIDRDPRPAPPTPTDARNLGRLLDQDRKMSSLRRSRLVDKWMDKPVVPPPPRRQRPCPPPPPPPVVSAVTDEDPDSFFSTTSVSTSDSGLSSTPSDAEMLTPSFDPSSKPKASCFGPFRAPKPVRTKAKAANDDQFEEKAASSSSSSSRAVKIYSQLKNLKQPISPGMKLAKYINSLTSRKKKTKNTDSKESDSSEARNRKSRAIPVPDRKYKSEQASPEWSFSSSSLTKPPYSTPTKVSSFITNETPAIAADSKASKRCEELRRLKHVGDVTGIDEVDVNRKVLEEVALDLLNSYWNRRNSDNGDADNKEDDDSTCSSSDLFEIDHLSLIGNEELPVYESTHLITS